MQYLTFSLWFTLIHTIAYIAAGAIALKISKDLYEEKERLLDFLRNMSDKGESKHVQKWFIPAQILRGLILSIVLYPIIGFLGEMSFTIRFLFLAGLLFFYTDFASAIPFNNNIEGFVYMKPKYLKKESFWKLYLETAIYSIMVGGFAGGLLF
ncbi:MAG: hypothetical protein ACOC5T_10025 [Elusimicrobiota bacterium]